MVYLWNRGIEKEEKITRDIEIGRIKIERGINKEIKIKIIKKRKRIINFKKRFEKIKGINR